MGMTLSSIQLRAMLTLPASAPGTMETATATGSGYKRATSPVSPVVSDAPELLNARGSLGGAQSLALWMAAKSFSHSLLPCGNHFVFGIYRGIIRHQGFLGGAGFHHLRNHAETMVCWYFYSGIESFQGLLGVANWFSSISRCPFLVVLLRK